MNSPSGWKPIPISLKIIFVLISLWVVGSIFAIPMRAESGLPFFGLYLYGVPAILILALLDIVAPIIFLVGLYKRKSWAPCVAYIYMSVFVLNSLVALFTVREELGTMPIVMPALFTLIFMGVIYRRRDYFEQK